MIELTDIHKTFGAVHALQGVNLRAEAGTIHGIVGENGAGKSTLMKVLTGFLHKSRGNITFFGQKTILDTPKDALQLGIGMLYQEPLDFPQLSVLENFMAGSRSYSPSVAKAELARLAAAFNFTFQPDDLVENLTIGERQQLEMLRLIESGVKVLILDEPTTGISDLQQQLLFAALNKLKNGGATILLVSHKLEEIDLLCDTVTVLRHGRVAATRHRPFDRNDLLQAMFDAPAEHHPPPQRSADRGPLLEFSGVTAGNGRACLQHLSLAIGTGEVVGLAGIDGSGQSVFLKTACGLMTPATGQVRHFSPTPDSTPTILGQDMVFLPADRLAEGLFPGLTIREHHLLASPGLPLLTPRSGLATTNEAITRHSIKGTPETMAETLSGGNQQRLLLSLIPKNVRLILMEDPTRGLDVQSAAWTWRFLHGRLQAGGAIIFASPDLDELMSEASRILVFYNGQIVLDTPTESTDYHTLSRAITGQIEVAPATLR